MTKSLQRLILAVLTLTVAGIVASAAGAAATDGGLLPALIGGDCGATSTPFAAFGDHNAYYPISDGDFASGGSGWTLSGGAALAPGSDPFLPHAAASLSLLIPDGGEAISPSACFGLLTPGVRFFARDAGSTAATLHVRVIATGLLGALSVLDGGTATIAPGWAPTPVFETTLSQLDVPVGTKSIKIEFTASGSVQLDDIYIDPFVSH